MAIVLSTNNQKREPRGLHPCECKGLAKGYEVESGAVTAEAWAGILARFEDVNVYQTWPYAALRWGERRLRHVVLRQGGEIVAAAQVIVARLPLLPGGLAYVKWGPLWRSPDSLRALLIALRTIYVDRRHMLLRVTPWEFEGSDQNIALQESGFLRNPAAERLRTAIVDLSYSLDELRASMTRHWRSHLKHAERNILDVQQGFTTDLMNEFTRVYFDMRRRKGEGLIPPMDYLPRLQDELPGPLKLRVAICRERGVPVAGLVVCAMGARAFALAAATASRGMEANGSYLLQWRMMEWLKQKNVRLYDLARINERTHPGTTQFKLGLSGKLGAVKEYLGEFQASDSWASRIVVSIADRLRAVGPMMLGAVPWPLPPGAR